MREISAPAQFCRGHNGSLELYGKQLFTGSAEQLLSALTKESSTNRPLLVMTLNVDLVLSLERQQPFLAAFHESWLRTLDGMPLVWLAKRLGMANPHRNTGADLIFSVCHHAVNHHWRVAIVGGRSGVAARAQARLSHINPGAEIQAFEFPYLTLNELNNSSSLPVISKLTSFAPSVVFLCLGAPKQEQWFSTWSSELPPAIYIGAGAAVDFAAGVASRAPGWAQAHGLEWVWRLLQEPRRLARRYLVEGPAFLRVILRSLQKARVDHSSHEKPTGPTRGRLD